MAMRKSSANAPAAVLAAGAANATRTDSASISMRATVASACDLGSVPGEPDFTPAFYVLSPQIGATSATIGTAAKSAAATLRPTTAINGTLTLDTCLEASGGLPVLVGACADIAAASTAMAP